MLRFLRIRNFAIIDELEMEFSSGFNAITGETGAGKSIILDAIGLILGNRANADIIRSGADEATVEAVFDVGQNEKTLERLAAFGVSLDQTEAQPERELLIRRAIHRNGKNKIFLNGELVTLSQLADATECLVELCSQHEHQSLAKSAFQLDMLDRYGGLFNKRREVAETFSAWKSSENELAALSTDGRGQSRTEDFLRFQIQEIEKFNAGETEEQDLVSERKRLLNATQLLETSAQVLAWLSGEGLEEQGAGSASSFLGKSLQKMQRLAELDPSLSEVVETLERALEEMTEAQNALQAYSEKLELDPSRLETVERRLIQWSEMKRKYGATAFEMNVVLQKLQHELSQFGQKKEKMEALERTISELKTVFAKLAQDLSKKRKSIAKTLTQTIENELNELMMPGTRYNVDFQSDAPSMDGIDRVSFLFSANPGEEPKPLGKIASGGELSRLMLAIRRTIADRGGIGVYLFDEIDAGIGGHTASVVGQKLKSVSKFNQVICITHLPQVASFADRHFSVSKKTAQGRTISKIRTLLDAERVEEVARMLGGLNLTEKSKAHAKELLKFAQARD